MKKLLNVLERKNKNTNKMPAKKTIKPIIEIPEKNLNLEKLGLINQGLFHVDGELARRYNSILKTVFDLDCKVDSFRIDKRGLSPELCEYFKDRFEFGDNYLNMRSATRFMIVISPDQQSAPLVAPQTSYDDTLFDEVYRQARHTIEDVTQSEAMFGELEDGIPHFDKPTDLLPLRTVEIKLETLNETIKHFFELRNLSDKLSEDDNAFNKDYEEKMRALVEKVGDIRTRAISKVFPITKEVHCFYVEFFKGVHCLRNFKNKARDPVRTIFVSHHQENNEDFGEAILNLDLHDPQLAAVLQRYNFIKYDETLLEQRLKELEDELLLSQDIDVVSLTPYSRQRNLRDLIKKQTPEYQELRGLYNLTKGANFSIKDAILDASPKAMLKLSRPVSKDDIVNHMLAELDPSDVRRLYEFNKRKLITEFPSLPVNRQRYIAHTLLNDTGGNK